LRADLALRVDQHAFGVVQNLTAQVQPPRQLPDKGAKPNALNLTSDADA